MKPIYLAFLLTGILSLAVKAQTKFYGLSSQEGQYAAGTLFHFNKTTSAFSVDKAFKAEHPGKTPAGQLVNYGNGKFYALDLDGGDNNSGVLFEWDSATNVYTKKYDFESSTGSSPNGVFPTGSLALYNGKLYGMTRAGGTTGQGVIFEYDPVNNIYTKMSDFDETNGVRPDGVLTLKDDLFYGVTSEGGSNGGGVIFEFNPLTQSCVGKFIFGDDAADGLLPLSITLKDGKFYGITAIGGNGGGALFEWDPAIPNGYTKKVDFDYSNGWGGNGSLTLKDGLFYGTTSSGANFGRGSIFEWDPVTNFYTKKLDLDPASGTSVSGPLTLLTSGHLFGTTTFDGVNSHGAIFDFDPVTSDYTIKFNFSDASGYNPQGFVLSTDKLFGLTQGGGDNLGGVLYEWDINAETYTKNIDLNYSSGAKPYGSLILGTNGNMYGMTSEGGSYDGGVIFELNSTTNAYTKKVDMQGNPRGTLILSSVNGKYYGVSTFGGGTTFGNIFEWDGSAKTVRDAHRFSYNDGLGYSPNGSLAEMNGKLYGMTQSGGANGAGVIFEYDPLNDAYTDIFDFDDTNGYDPLCTLTGKDGILYGMTAYGGIHSTNYTYGAGVVFKITPGVPNSYTYIVFNEINGANPYGALTFKDGKFYGLAQSGGANGAGVIFEWDPANTFITVRYNFNSYDGGYPDASLILGADGRFYATTAYGGLNGSGVIFQWDPSSNNYTNLFDFGGDNGANPTGNLLIADNFCSTLPGAPTNTTDPANLNVAPGNSTTLAASGAGTIGWYSAATGGTYLGGGNSFTTPALNSTTSFYVQDSTACGPSPNRTGITVTVDVTSPPCNTNAWTSAAQNGNWNDPANWCSGMAPTTVTDAIVPTGATPYPNLSADAAVKSLELQTGSSISIGAYTLSINGAITGTGTLTGSALSNIITTANTTLNFSPGANILKDLTVSNDTSILGSPLNITGGNAPNSFGTVTITPGSSLITGGNLTLQSNQYGTARVATGAANGFYIVGEVTVERYIPANSHRAWRALSIPTYGNGQTIHQGWQENAASPASNPVPGYGTNISSTAANFANGFDFITPINSIARYNASNDNWDEVTSTNIPAETRSGYYVYIRGDRTVGPSAATNNTTATTLRTTGNLYQGAQVSPTIPANKFECIGNIYASAIDFTKLVRTPEYAAAVAGVSPEVPGVANVFYIWDPKVISGTTLGIFQTFSATNGFACVPGFGSFASGEVNTKVQSGQAFMVHAVRASGAVTFNEDCKVASSKNVFRPATPASLPAKLTTRLYAASGTVADANVVVFDRVYTNEVNGDDAMKLANTGENFAIQRSDKKLVIEGRQPVINTDTLFFTMWNMQQQQYQLEFLPVNIPGVLTAYLEDSYRGTKSFVDLTAANTVNFTVDANAASSANDRFHIIFRQSAPLPLSFISVSANKLPAGINVAWKVTGERGIQQYEIERSADGMSFTNAGVVDASGNLNNDVSYNWLDGGALTGDNFYRVKSIGINGEIKYSSIVKVNIGKHIPSITVSPNPVEGNTINLQFSNVPEGVYTIRLLRVTGQSVLTKNILHAGGNCSQVLTLPSVIARGAYQLEIIDPNKEKRVQILLVHSK